MIETGALIGTHDVLFVTFDSLRLDVAAAALERGLTPNLAAVLPGGRWEARHTPGTFTYAAHQAFFAGFLPTPVAPGKHPRLFAARFEGSETTGPGTFTFEEASWVQALAKRGYHTFCFGGVGFFNSQGALGSSLPGLFEHAYWSRSTGAGSPRSAELQVSRATSVLRELGRDERALVFLNLSATHRPTHVFVPGATEDSFETQLAGLASTDGPLGELFGRLRARGSCLAILCADHGEAFGEDGYWGHRVAHPTVLTVPYAEFILEADP